MSGLSTLVIAEDGDAAGVEDEDYDGFDVVPLSTTSRKLVMKKTQQSLITPRKVLRTMMLPKNPSSKRLARHKSGTASVAYSRDTKALPTVLLHHIFSFAQIDNAEDLAHLEMISRQFKVAMDPSYAIVSNLWRNLLIKDWGSDLLTPEEYERGLTLKQVYETRYTESSRPVKTANRRVQRENRKTSFLQSPEEFSLALWKHPAQTERGRIQHYIYTLQAGNPLDDEDELLERARENPIYSPVLIKKLYSEDLNEVLESVVRYRHMLSRVNDPDITAVVESKVIPQLVKILAASSASLQKHHSIDASLVELYHRLRFETIWVITNIASGTTEHVAEVVRAGALPKLVNVLFDPDLPIDDVVIEQAIWALGNVSGENATFCQVVLDHEPLAILYSRFKEKEHILRLRPEFIRNVCWFLGNFARARPRPPFWRIRRVVDILSSTIVSRDLGIVSETCWALSYLTQELEPRYAVYFLDFIPTEMLFRLLSHRSRSVSAPAFRCVSRLLDVSAGVRQRMLLEGLVETIDRLWTTRAATTAHVAEDCTALVSTLANAWEFDFDGLVSVFPQLRLERQTPAL